MEIKQNTPPVGGLPVEFVSSSTGLPITGKIHSDVTLYTKKGDGAIAARALSSGELTEISAANAPGSYTLNLIAGDFDTVGKFQYWASVSGSSVWRNRDDYEVVANVLDDVYSRVGAPAGASIAADIAAVNTDVASVKTDTGTTIPATLVTLATAVALAQGLSGYRRVTDQITRDSRGNVTAARIRWYDSKANADGAYAASPATYDTGKLAEVTYSATTTSSGVTTEEIA